MSGRIERIRRCKLALVAVAALVFSAPALRAEESVERYRLADLKALERAFVSLAERVQPSVVAIRTYRLVDPVPDHPTEIPMPLSQGAGFVIDPEGLILTNRHVLERADVIKVILHTRHEYNATLVQDDMRSDLAVIRVDADHLRPVTWGDATTLRVNQWAFAAGNPFGLANDTGEASITYGVVSALGRKLTHRLARNSELEYYDNLIETSAAINPGSSGGPLFNLDGQVIGIATAIESASGVNEGVGFAIPIDRYTRTIIDTLKEGQPMRYGFLGVSVIDNAQRSPLVVDLQGGRGARIARVFADTPAEQAGLHVDDVVLEFNGTPVRGQDHLVRLVSVTPVGQQVPLVVQRGRMKHTAVVTIGDRFNLLGFQATDKPSE